ncbi:uncharacterized protein LOC142564041 [Dermacentor variabilis]|uniref:uncharacterized protein LOC142564041 n=1 Tax=Dermacentor variabilis TaxID=34621 RepID=UPI003F5C3489
MASSSLSQEDVDHELEVQCSRRSRIRTARAVTRTAAPLAVRDLSAPDCELGSLALECGGGDHDASPKPRAKDKRCPRPNHANKCKAQRERRKLREKRRSTGVVHLQSTESTGGSTGEDEELLNMSAETRRNTTLNEALHQQDGASHAISSSAVPSGGATMTGTAAFQESRPFGRPCKCRNTKSPSDRDADDEDNQEYDSAVNQSDGGNLSSQGTALAPLPSSSLSRGVADWEDSTGGNQEALQRALGEAERVQEEVRRLVQLLKEKELRIHSLERRVLAMAKELSEVTAENRELREMNSALLDGVPLAMQPPAKE